MSEVAAVAAVRKRERPKVRPQCPAGKSSQNFPTHQKQKGRRPAREGPATAPYGPVRGWATHRVSGLNRRVGCEDNRTFLAACSRLIPQDPRLTHRHPTQNRQLL